MTKLRVMGVLLILLAVLVAVSMVLHIDGLWSFTDITMVLTTVTCGILLLKHKSNV